MDTGPVGLAGLGHHVLGQRHGLLHDDVDEGVLGSMGSLVGKILKLAPKKIIHWVEIWPVGAQLGLGDKVKATAFEARGPCLPEHVESVTVH